jgi:GNAT superfamily N-acetyltransferase
MTTAPLLRPVETSEDWAALHAIRRAVLFVPGRPLGHVTYDDNHPDDRKPGNQPYVLVVDGRPIGTTRLDRRGDDAGVVRLVAILNAEQGRGHGRILGDLVEEIARRNGWSALLVNAAATAEGYYARMGWQRHVWDEAELAGVSSACTQMRKRL